MLKKILTTLFSVFLLSSTLIIFYWQDSKFDPSPQDLLLYFILLPCLISLVLLSPYLIWSWYKTSVEKKQQKMDAEPTSTDLSAQASVDIEHIRLNVYSSSLLSAMGKNQEIFNQMDQMQAPTLDPVFKNQFGHPILSYRIPEQFDANLEDESAEHFIASIQKRIQTFMLAEFYENEAILLSLVEHLKQSAMFYDQQLAYEYRIHPAWIKPDAEHEDDIQVLKDIPRLNVLNMYVVLSDAYLHVWNESDSEQLIRDFLENLGLLSQQVKIHYHYWDAQNAYSEWLNLLKKISTQSFEVSFLLVTDSALDQEVIDDHLWQAEQFIPAEFIGSCCLASEAVQILETSKLKGIDLLLNETSVAHSLKRFEIEHLEQYDLENPFVLLPDNITQAKVVQQISNYFAASAIQPHHYLYSHYSLGHTQDLAKIYAFILGLQAPESLQSFMYSLDAAQTLVRFHTEESLTEFTNI